jgi:hypothetical protein
MKCVCGYEEKYIQGPENSQSEYPDNEPFYRAGLTVTIDKQQGQWDCRRFVQKEVFICPQCGTLKINPV